MYANPFEQAPTPRKPEKTSPEEDIVLLDMRIESAYENYRIMADALEEKPEPRQEEPQYSESKMMKVARYLADRPIPTLRNKYKVFISDAQKTDIARQALDIRHKIKEMIDEHEWLAKKLQSIDEATVDAGTKTKKISLEMEKDAASLEEVAGIKERVGSALGRILSIKDAEERSVEMAERLKDMNEAETEMLIGRMRAEAPEFLCANLLLLDEDTRSKFVARHQGLIKKYVPELGLKKKENVMRIINRGRLDEASYITKKFLGNMDPQDKGGISEIADAYFYRFANQVYTDYGYSDYAFLESEKEEVFSRRRLDPDQPKLKRLFSDEPKNFDRIKKILFESMMIQFGRTIAEHKDPSKDRMGLPHNGFLLKQIINKAKALLPLLNEDEVRGLAERIEAVDPRLFDWSESSSWGGKFDEPGQRQELRKVFEDAMPRAKLKIAS